MTGNASTVTLQVIKEAQLKHVARKPRDTALTTDGLVAFEDGKLWVPESEGRLKAHIIATAHALGSAGHRGAIDTKKRITKHFRWKNMKDDISEVLERCGWCMKTSANRVVPRPHASAVHAKRPGQVLHSDYYFVTSKGGTSTPKYLIALKDDFSRHLYLKAVHKADADTTASVFAEYFATYANVPAWWTTDGGSHYRNATMKQLAYISGADHHITTPHSPFANGTIESAFKPVRKQLLTVLKKTGTKEEDWPRVLPAVMFALNNTHLDALGSRTPAQVLIGRDPTTSFDALFDAEMEAYRRLAGGPATAEQVATECGKLRDALEDAQKAVRERKPPPSSRTAKPPSFGIGDYVLKARVDKEARNKLRSNWVGPMRVVDTVNDQVFVVKGLMADDDEYHVHSSRLVFYAPKGMILNDVVMDMLAHDDGGREVEAIVGHRMTDGDIELHVKWLGFDIGDSDAMSWEPAAELMIAARKPVRKYTKTLPAGPDKATLLDLLAGVI